LNNDHRKGPKPGRRGRRRPGAPASLQPVHAPVPLGEDGVPLAVPDAPRPSPVVFVAAESLARYPWLPARVIAGSIWRGPANEKVRVDERGVAVT
jgi:hypothetical protein